MEHPDVIREIDALIDSYNWDGIVDDSVNFVKSIKLSFQTQQARISMRLASDQGILAVGELLVQILQNPRVKHKGWILEAIPYHSGIGGRRRSSWDKGYALFLKSVIPLLHRYTQHRNPKYRIQALGNLCLLNSNADQTARWLLDHLSYEHSFENIAETLYRLGTFFEDDRWKRINRETLQRLIHRVESLLKSRSPEIRIEAAALLLKIKQHTPQHVVEVIIEGWSHIDAYRRNHFLVLIGFHVWVYKVGRAKVLNFVTALLKSSQQFIVGLIIWEEIGENYFGLCMGMRRLVLSQEQKIFLEAALACKPLWRTREVAVPEHHDRSGYVIQPWRWGLENTRSNLYQQLKHARIVDSTQEVYSLSPQGERLPLRLDSELLRNIES